MLSGRTFSPLWTNHYEDWAYKIRKKADELGITFVQTHVPFYNFCDPKKGVNENTEEIVRRSIVCTNILGAHWTVSHPGTAYADSLIVDGSKSRIWNIFQKSGICKEE